MDLTYIFYKRVIKNKKIPTMEHTQSVVQGVGGWVGVQRHHLTFPPAERPDL